MDKRLKIGLIIGGILLALSFIVLPLAGLATGWQGCGYETEEYHMMGPWMMGGFGFGWLIPIFWIVVLGLLIWAAIALTGGRDSLRNQESLKSKSALEILKERYARGDISKEEFEDKRKDLM